MEDEECERLSGSFEERQRRPGQERVDNGAESTGRPFIWTWRSEEEWTSAGIHPSDREATRGAKVPREDLRPGPPPPF